MLNRLRREAAQVDRDLEAALQETNRLRQLLREREDAVQRLRERVAAQRSARLAREAARKIVKKYLN